EGGEGAGAAGGRGAVEGGRVRRGDVRRGVVAAVEHGGPPWPSGRAAGFLPAGTSRRDQPGGSPLLRRCAGAGGPARVSRGCAAAWPAPPPPCAGCGTTGPASRRARRRRTAPCTAAAAGPARG